MKAELAWLLWEASLAGTAAVALVLALRRPLRAAFGAGAAYAAWGVVPAALMAVLVPAAATPLVPILMAAAPGIARAVAAPALAPAADRSAWLLALWAAGVLVLAAMQFRQQRAFMHSLGPLLQRPDGLLQSAASAGLPAVIGWRARIVLPQDFEARYDATERALVLCHEDVHRRRGDLYASAVVALLRCAFWFNPLIAYAAGRFRQDQELACDAAVLQRHPGLRRRYGDALLKTQLAGQALPIGCHWFGSHPLKERIAMLKHARTSTFRRAVGGALALALVFGGAFTAWAAQPPAVREGLLDIAVAISVDGGVESRSSLQTPAGETFGIASGEGDARWMAEFSARPADVGTFLISGTLSRGGKLVASPALQVAEGRAAVFQVSTPDGASVVRMELTITRATQDKAAAELRAVGIEGSKPQYPMQALANNESGTVMLRVLVAADGKAIRSEFEPAGSTVPAGSRLVHSAQKAALEWRFNPEKFEGKAIEGWVLVPVRFEADPGEG